MYLVVKIRVYFLKSSFQRRWFYFSYLLYKYSSQKPLSQKKYTYKQISLVLLLMLKKNEIDFVIDPCEYLNMIISQSEQSWQKNYYFSLYYEYS